MGIDWSQIRTIDDVMALGEDDLYDFAPEYDADAVYRLADGLTDEEKDDAEFWKQYRRGLMLVTGPPGQGKDLFLHMLAYKMKRYFMMNAILDSKPRKLFGTYIPFSQEFLVEQLDRLMEVSTGVVKDFDPENPPLVKPHVERDGRWISSRGEVFIRRAVWGLNEFGSRYMYRREPHQPIKRALLKTFTIWRHLQSLIIGVGTEREDIDGSCFPKVTCEVRMQRLSVLDGRILNPERLVFGAMIYPLRYVSATGELMVSGKPQPLVIDADVPKDCLSGYAWKDLFNTDNAVGFEPPKSMRRKRQ